MGTKENPAAFDCYGNAKPDEPMFILLARDVTAPEIVEQWAIRRMNLISGGLKPESDRAMVDEARECANAMRRWRYMHEATKPRPSRA
jgi:hypothetical protein